MRRMREDEGQSACVSHKEAKLLRQVRRRSHAAERGATRLVSRDSQQTLSSPCFCEAALLRSCCRSRPLPPSLRGQRLQICWSEPPRDEQGSVHPWGAQMSSNGPVSSLLIIMGCSSSSTVSMQRFAGLLLF